MRAGLTKRVMKGQDESDVAHVREPQGPPLEAGESKNDFSPHDLGREPGTLHHSSCERLHFCGFRPPVCYHLLWQPWDASTCPQASAINNRTLLVTYIGQKAVDESSQVRTNQLHRSPQHSAHQHVEEELWRKAKVPLVCEVELGV